MAKWQQKRPQVDAAQFVLVFRSLFVEAVEPFVDGAVDLTVAFAFRVVVVARLGLVVIVGRILTRLDVFDGIVEAFGNFLKIFLVKKDLVLFV